MLDDFAELIIEVGDPQRRNRAGRIFASLCDQFLCAGRGGWDALETGINVSVGIALSTKTNQRHPAKTVDCFFQDVQGFGMVCRDANYALCDAYRRQWPDTTVAQCQG